MASSSFSNLNPRPFSFLVHILAVLSVVFVSIWTFYFRGGVAFSSPNKDLIFNLHPLLTVIGFVFLYSEANLVFRTLPASKRVQKIIHLSLQHLALIVGIVGVWAAFTYQIEIRFENVFSLHCWVGLITICLFGVQWLIGFVTFFYPGLSPPSRAFVLPWHVFLGLFIFGLVLTTVELGLMEKLTFLQTFEGVVRFSSESMLVNGLGIILVLLGWFMFLTAAIPEAKVVDHSESKPTDDSQIPLETV